MEKPAQLPVAGRIMGSVDRVVILAEKLSTLPLRQSPENYGRIVGILRLNRLSGHAIQVTLRPGSRRGAQPSQQNDTW